MKLQENAALLKKYAEIILAMKKALGYRIDLTTFDATYPVQSATQLHTRLIARSIPDEIENAFAAIMRETEMEWVREHIPPVSQYPMFAALMEFNS